MGVSQRRSRRRRRCGLARGERCRLGNALDRETLLQDGRGPLCCGRQMTELAAAPGRTVQLIRRVSSRAEAGLSPTVLLERVCEAVVDALAFDRIAGIRYHTPAGEVSEVAVAGIPSAKGAERRPLTSIPLLAEALDAQ